MRLRAKRSASANSRILIVLVRFHVPPRAGSHQYGFDHSRREQRYRVRRADGEHPQAHLNLGDVLGAGQRNGIEPLGKGVCSREEAGDLVPRHPAIGRILYRHQVCAILSRDTRCRIQNQRRGEGRKAGEPAGGQARAGIGQVAVAAANIRIAKQTEAGVAPGAAGVLNRWQDRLRRGFKWRLADPARDARRGGLGRDLREQRVYRCLNLDQRLVSVRVVGLNVLQRWQAQQHKYSPQRRRGTEKTHAAVAKKSPASEEAGYRSPQFRPRTGAQGSARSEAINFCSLNHAPAALVPTLNATRSAGTLTGNSRSFEPGFDSASVGNAIGFIPPGGSAVTLRLPAPSTNCAR